MVQNIYGINLLKDAKLYKLECSNTDLYDNQIILRHLHGYNGNGSYSFKIKTKGELPLVSLPNGWTLSPEFELHYNWSGYLANLVFYDSKNNSITKLFSNSTSLFKTDMLELMNEIISFILDVTDYNSVFENELLVLKDGVTKSDSLYFNDLLSNMTAVTNLWIKYTDFTKTYEPSEALAVKLRGDIKLIADILAKRILESKV